MYMYNATGLTKGLSLTKVIGGINKTLQVMNQVIPLYQKAKPLITNARSIFSVIKDISKNKATQDISIKNNQPSSTKIMDQKKESITTSPTFFL